MVLPRTFIVVSTCVYLSRLAEEKKDKTVVPDDYVVKIKDSVKSHDYEGLDSGMWNCISHLVSVADQKL